MVNFVYKNVTYFIKNASFQQLLQSPELLRHDLDFWKHLVFNLYKDESIYYLKQVLEYKITAYDSSSSVNEFYINDKKGWFNKATRQSLYRLCEAVDKNVEIILENEVVSIPKDVLKEFLKKLEVYAYQCYTQTANHLYTITTFKTQQEFLDYDYTKNYPKKLVLSV